MAVPLGQKVFNDRRGMTLTLTIFYDINEGMGFAVISLPCQFCSEERLSVFMLLLEYEYWVARLINVNLGFALLVGNRSVGPRWSSDLICSESISLEKSRVK